MVSKADIQTLESESLSLHKRRGELERDHAATVREITRLEALISDLIVKDKNVDADMARLESLRVKMTGIERAFEVLDNRNRQILEEIKRARVREYIEMQDAYRPRLMGFINDLDTVLKSYEALQSSYDDLAKMREWAGVGIDTPECDNRLVTLQNYIVSVFRPMRANLERHDYRKGKK